ncbi:MAG: hypothetical protein IPH88_16785 [Bacteroidales bacterium]|nr:hypothetical protein [Bacteroidales bacterium]
MVPDGNFPDPTMLCSTDDAELGTDAGGKMKETGTLHFGCPANTGATNTSGFTALVLVKGILMAIFYVLQHSPLSGLPV